MKKHENLIRGSETLTDKIIDLLADSTMTSSEEQFAVHLTALSCAMARLMFDEANRNAEASRFDHMGARYTQICKGMKDQMWAILRTELAKRPRDKRATVEVIELFMALREEGLK